MKLFRKILIGLFGVIVLFVATGIYIVSRHESMVGKFIIDEINKSVSSKINVKSVRLTLIDNFPSASLAFDELFIPSVFNENDTLLYADKAFLELNVFSLFRDNYIIEGVKVQDGTGRFLINKQGKGNYEIFKNSGPSESFTSIEKLEINNMLLSYFNHESDFHLNGKIPSGTLKGTFFSEDVTMDGEMEFQNFSSSSGSKSIVSNQSIELVFETSGKKNLWTFSNSSMNISGEPLSFDGNINTSKDNILLDLTIKGDDNDPEQLISIFPDLTKQFSKDYLIKGALKLDIKLKGLVSHNSPPEINATAVLKKGTLRKKNTSYQINDVFFQAIYSNGKNKNMASSELQIKDLKCVMGSGIIKGNMTLRNFSKPILKAECDAVFEPSDFLNIFPVDTIEKLDGKMNLKASFQGPVGDLSRISKKELHALKLNGECKIDKGYLVLKGDRLPARNINASVNFNNNDLFVDQLYFESGTSDFSFKGVFGNFLPYILLSDEKLIVESVLTSNRLDLEDVLMPSAEQESKADLKVVFPTSVLLNINANIESFQFRNFSAKKIKGVFQVSSKGIDIQNTMMNTLDGQVVVNGSCRSLFADKLVYSAHFVGNNMDINKTFKVFNNFGQTYIEARHLSGSAELDIDFGAVSDRFLNFIPEKITAFADVKIEKGELKQFAPLKEIPMYMKTNKILNAMVNVDEFENKLNHIRFSQMQNTISIRDNKISIPSMTVQSSAMQLDLIGTHTFEHQVDYTFSFLLGEILTKNKKKKDNRKSNTDHSGMKKTLIVLKVKGHIDDPDITWDRSNINEKVKSQVDNEKKEVKAVLHEEFGVFNSDSVSAPTREKPVFKVQWDEFNNDSLNNQSEKRDSTSQQRIKKLFRQPEGNKKTNTDDFNFDDDDF